MEYILYLNEYLKSFFITGLLGLAIYFLINIGNRYLDEEDRFVIRKKQIIYTLIVILIILILYYFFSGSSGAMDLLSPILYSIGFAYLLNPLVNLLERRGIKRIWGVLIVYVALIGTIIIIGLAIFPQIANEFQNLMVVLPGYFNEVYDFFNDLYIRYSENIANLPPEFQSIEDVIGDNLDNIQNAVVTGVKNLTNSIIGMFSRIISFVIIPILTFYFIKDKDYFKKKIHMMIPKKHRTEVTRLSREIDVVLGKFIRGQLIVASFIGVATAIGLLIMNINFALIIGLIAGIANVIPYFGPVIGIIPGVFFALLDAPIKALWVIIFFTIIQQIESSVLAPKIVGDSVGLHPVVIIVSLLLGGRFFGIIGMLLAVPTAAVIKILSGFIIEKLAKV